MQRQEVRWMQDTRQSGYQTQELARFSPVLAENLATLQNISLATGGDTDGLRVLSLSLQNLSRRDRQTDREGAPLYSYQKAIIGLGLTRPILSNSNTFVMGHLL